MTQTAAAIDAIDRVGGHPAVDFVNTADTWRDGRPGREYLADYAALARWHAATGLVDRRALRRFGEAGARARHAAWQKALGLRNVLYRLFAAAAAGDPLPQPALDELQRVLEQTVPWRRLRATRDGAAFGWDFAGAPPAAILGPVAWAAAGLLQNGPLDRLKACPPGDGCGWLFLDLSRNRSRTWCSMKTCGNTAKVRRFRSRTAPDDTKRR